MGKISVGTMAPTSALVPTPLASEGQPRNSGDVENRPPTGKGRKTSSRDMLSSMNSYLTRCELAMGEIQEQVEDIEKSIKELDSIREELKGEMQGALNEAMDVHMRRNESLEAHVVAMRGELEQFRGELAALRAIMVARPI